MRLQVGWSNIWGGLAATRIWPETHRRQREEQALRQEVERARREVEAAEQYFQRVTEPDLVDHAIFTLEAAQRKYLYLYRSLRRMRGSTVDLKQGESEWM